AREVPARGWGQPGHRARGRSPARPRRPIGSPPTVGRSTPMTGARTRVVVADDDRAVRQALADLVSARPDLELVGTAGDHPDAVRQAVRHRPDVLVLDDRMPGGSAAS